MLLDVYGAQLSLLFTEVVRKGCLVKASHSGKVVCPIEAKWVLPRPHPFYPAFRAQSRIEKHMKDYVRGPTEAR